MCTQLSNRDIREIENALNEMERLARGVSGAGVVTLDASPIADNMGKDINRDRAAAMTGTIAKLGKMVTEVGRIGELEYIVLAGRNGQILVSPLSPEFNLVTHTVSNSQIGGVLLAVQRATERIRQVLNLNE